MYGPCHRLPNNFASIKSLVLQRDTCVPLRPRGISNRIIKEVSDQKATGPSSNLMSSPWSLKSRDSHHAYAEFRVIQGGSNMTGTDLCVRLYKSVPVIFEPPCTNGVHLFITSFISSAR